MESVRWMVGLAVRAGALRIVLNGSFVTDIMEPNDVDCVLLFSPERHRDAESLRELRIGLPFLEISMVDEEEFDVLVNAFFKAVMSNFNCNNLEADSSVDFRGC